MPPKPNPKRVAAGRLNQVKRGPLTVEARARIRMAALTNQPWQFSTGPRTAEGKAIAAQNGLYSQVGSISIRESRDEVASLLASIAALADHIDSLAGCSCWEQQGMEVKDDSKD